MNTIFYEKETLLKGALQFQSEKLYDLAVFYYKKILEKEPADEICLNQLSLIKYENGNTQRALELSNKLIQVNSQCADYYNNRGNINWRLGQFESAITDFDQAINIGNNRAEFYVNRSNVHVALSQIEEAVLDIDKAINIDSKLATAYAAKANILSIKKDYKNALIQIQKAINVDEGNAQFYFDRGAIEVELNQINKAINSYDTACKLDNNFIESYKELIALLLAKNRHNEAVDILRYVIQIDTENIEWLMTLAETYIELNNIEKARQIYLLAKYKSQDHPSVDFFLSAYFGGTPPAKSPDKILTRLFDAYAEDFNHHLVSKLDYKAPAQLKEQLLRLNKNKIKSVIDLGCGTGLIGQEFYGLYQSIDGVDISQKMLDICRTTGLYRKLYKEEISNFIADKNTHYDLAVCADVFVYIGDLFYIFEVVYKLLNQQGWFSFSIEESNNETIGYELKNTKRFSHSIPYINKIVDIIGFEIIEIKKETIRNEKLEPVSGFSILLRKI